MNKLMQFSGIKAYRWQSYSALYLLFYFPYLSYAFFNAKTIEISLAEFLNTLFTPIFSLLSLMAIVALFIHTWIGLRDIAIDYLPDHKVRFWLGSYWIFLALLAMDLLWLAFQAFNI